MLTGPERQALLGIARNAIARDLGLPHEKYTHPTTGPLAGGAGAFVTLHMRGRLRGCIGYIESPEALAEVVRKAAGKAAFHDPRFPPVTSREFHQIAIEISVLTPPALVKDVSLIEIGRDGLIVELGLARGLLLPQVAIEQGWDRLEFVENACAKAGLPGDAWMDPAARLYTFHAEVFSEPEAHEVAS
ncbi:MAG TPA: AmmeMemoRadiSam system protein A [Bacteroidota bacterium]|nr:AmmeMemoRadiSam system protein A [Bacteroidota bacterium]